MMESEQINAIHYAMRLILYKTNISNLDIKAIEKTFGLTYDEVKFAFSIVEAAEEAESKSLQNFSEQQINFHILALANETKALINETLASATYETYKYSSELLQLLRSDPNYINGTKEDKISIEKLNKATIDLLINEYLGTETEFIEEEGEAKKKQNHLIGYGQQLREKQKVKRIYHILEKQFRNYFEEAVQQKGITGENLLFLLERRLDNVVYRAGFASSRRQARKLVNDGQVRVNGKTVDIPSFQVKINDVIDIKEINKNKSTKKQKDTLPAWIVQSKSSDIAVRIETLPTKEDIRL